MNLMIKSCILLLNALFLLGVTESNAQTAASTYFSKNVAVVNAQVRSLNSTTYVREMVLVDFANQQSLPTKFGFRTDGFSDDGTGFDAQAGDGIYTSKDAYNHTASVPYIANKPVRSAVKGPITDYSFLHDNPLNTFVTNTGIQYTSAFKGGIKVKLVECPCPQECICVACEWGWTNWCLRLTEVEIEIGW